MRKRVPNVQSQSSQSDAALTPRPGRLLLVGRVAPGEETDVRDVQADFPYQAATEAGIDAVEAFIGSGYYAIWLEIDQDDVQEVLAAYLNDPRVRAFHANLQPVVEGLPAVGWVFGPSDPFHDASESEPPPGPVYGAADLSLAASMYRWRAGEPPMVGVTPEGRASG